MAELMHMKPEQVREVSRKVEQFSEDLRDAVAKIVHGAEGMDWSSAEKDEFVADIRAWEGNVFPTQVTCDVLKRKLVDEVEEWESAAAKFGWGSQGYTPFLVGSDDAAAVNLDDVDQGGLGTCYLMASLIALAQQHPELIEQMIHDNGDGTFTVTFHEKRCESAVGPCTYVDVPITVDMDFPPGDYDGYAYGEPGDTTRRSKEMWSMLIERAYAKWKGGYDNIDGGWPFDSLSALTGMDCSNYSPAEMEFNELYESFQNGDAVTATSWTGEHRDITDNLPEYQNGKIVKNHVYAITKIDPESQTVTLVNPWNDSCQPIVLPYEEYQKLFEITTTNPIRG